MEGATESGARGSPARVVLAVTGSIASYKACEVVRGLQEAGVTVRVTLTPRAAQFVSPLTFAALSGHRVLVDPFDDRRAERLPHVRWAEWCDAFCVVPATADFLARMALGIADDFPSTLYLAVDAPVLVAPAMEDRMWSHPAVRRNLELLRGRGVVVVGPAEGRLASGRWAPGRLAEPEAVVAAILALSAAGEGRGALVGQRVLVTAGPTREPLDPVRFLSNPSSGRMGFAVAAAAHRRGAEVVLVAGPTALEPPAGVRVVRVATAREMAAEVLRQAPAADVVVMAAAVADYRPARPSRGKLRKAAAERLTVELVRNPDILARVAELPGDRLVVGFAAETEELEVRAREKLRAKGCDLIVANRVGDPGMGFGADTNAVVILDRLGGRREFGPAAKAEVAEAIWDAVLAYREKVAAPAPAGRA